MAKKNAFEELLASINEDGDRQVITGLAEKYPVLRDSVLMRADYSRQSDELKTERERLKAEADYATAMKQWREANWVDNAYGDGKGALRRELEKDDRIAELEAKIPELEAKIQTGDEVTFADFDKYLQDKKLVSQDAIGKIIDERASGVKQTVDQSLAGLSHIALKAPRLAVRHYKEFDEELDLDGLVEYANKSGLNDLDAAYNSQVAERRKEIEAKKHAEEIENARRLAKEEALKELGDRHPARMPDDSTGPEVGHFFKKLNGARNQEEAADPPLGRIAATLGPNWNAQKSE